MSFQGTTGRGALMALLALAMGGCGGHSSAPLTPSPTFSEGTGTYVGTQTITITDTATSATIYYTTDGTTPTTASSLYTAAGIPVGSSLTLEAIAVEAGHRNSSVASATYVIAPAMIPTAGIWLGTDSISGKEVLALINAAGQAVFIRSDYTQYAGALTVADAAISATLNGFANFPGTFADGSISGTGTLTATVNQATSIDGTLAFQSSNGTAYPGDYALGYVTTSTSGSSVASGAAILGSYADNGTNDPNTGGTVTITSVTTNGVTSGVLASAGATSGCVMSGSINTADTTTDIYEVSYSYSGCNGVFSTLNGITFTGLAALNSDNSPVQLLMAVNGPGGGATSYGLVSSLILN